jgi:Ni,Fe-hydrogenase III large subunit
LNGHEDTPAAVSVDTFSERVVARVARGARFCGLFASADSGGNRLTAVLAEGNSLRSEVTVVPDTTEGFPTLSTELPSASWYEREIHDLFGLKPLDNASLDPLVLPLKAGSKYPCPGSGEPASPIEIDPTPSRTRLLGEGVFTIPYGPVRSGVFESVEYVVETPGEDIPYVVPRVFYKHRGIEARFDGTSVDDGVLVAERYEGVASVAHAIAYCTAIETIAGVEVKEAANFVRIVHAELERIVNHLESVVRNTEAAGQAVAYARLTLHKERLQRLRARLCGSRFGRSVVVPGGVTGPPRLDSNTLLAGLDGIEKDIRSDLSLLMSTPSFIDRLRATGVIPPDLARQHGAVGPVGRGSGQVEDVRFTRPYSGYQLLGHQLIEPRIDGDALARQRVRLDEIAGAFHLVRQAIDRLSELAVDDADWRVPVELANGESISGKSISGEAIGWAEAPQGELLYLVTVDDGVLKRVKPRSASFHNLALFSAAFPKEVLTDFAFIEASFGVSIAGVAG